MSGRRSSSRLRRQVQEVRRSHKASSNRKQEYRPKRAAAVRGKIKIAKSIVPPHLSDSYEESTSQDSTQVSSEFAPSLSDFKSSSAPTPDLSSASVTPDVSQRVRRPNLRPRRDEIQFTSEDDSSDNVRTSDVTRSERASRSESGAASECESENKTGRSSCTPSCTPGDSRAHSTVPNHSATKDASVESSAKDTTDHDSDSQANKAARKRDKKKYNVIETKMRRVTVLIENMSKSVKSSKNRDVYTKKRAKTSSQSKESSPEPQKTDQSSKHSVEATSQGSATETEVESQAETGVLTSKQQPPDSGLPETGTLDSSKKKRATKPEIRQNGSKRGKRSRPAKKTDKAVVNGVSATDSEACSKTNSKRTPCESDVPTLESASSDNSQHHSPERHSPSREEDPAQDSSATVSKRKAGVKRRKTAKKGKTESQKDEKEATADPKAESKEANGVDDQKTEAKEMTTSKPQNSKQDDVSTSAASTDAETKMLKTEKGNKRRGKKQKSDSEDGKVEEGGKRRGRKRKSETEDWKVKEGSKRRGRKRKSDSEDGKVEEEGKRRGRKRKSDIADGNKKNSKSDDMSKQSNNSGETDENTSKEQDETIDIKKRKVSDGDQAKTKVDASNKQGDDSDEEKNDDAGDEPKREGDDAGDDQMLNVIAKENEIKVEAENTSKIKAESHDDASKVTFADDGKGCEKNATVPSAVGNLSATSGRSMTSSPTDTEVPRRSASSATCGSGMSSVNTPMTSEPEEEESSAHPATKRFPASSKVNDNNCAGGLPLADKYVGSQVAFRGGALDQVIDSAVNIGARAFSFYLKPQKTWQLPEIDDDAIESFRTGLKTRGYSPYMVVVRGGQMMNLASSDKKKREKSLTVFHQQLQTCRRLGLPYFSFRPGTRNNSTSAEAAILRIAEAINTTLEKTRDVIAVLEYQCCQGHTVGGVFDELRDIIKLVNMKARIGVSINTCHLVASGYDLRTREGFSQAMKEFEESVGLDYLKIIYVSDSKGEVGSRLDQHADIGDGVIGTLGFKLLMADSRFSDTPIILDIPCSDVSKQIRHLYKFCD